MYQIGEFVSGEDGFRYSTFYRGCQLDEPRSFSDNRQRNTFVKWL